jgi:hypothetical protein
VTETPPPAFPAEAAPLRRCAEPGPFPGGAIGTFVLLYRRAEEPRIGLRDPERAEKERQFGLVEQFFAGLRRPDGSITASWHDYGKPEDLIDLLSDHIQHRVRTLLDAS